MGFIGFGSPKTVFVVRSTISVPLIKPSLRQRKSLTWTVPSYDVISELSIIYINLKTYRTVSNIYKNSDVEENIHSFTFTIAIVESGRNRDHVVEQASNCGGLKLDTNLTLLITRLTAFRQLSTANKTIIQRYNTLNTNI